MMRQSVFGSSKKVRWQLCLGFLLIITAIGHIIRIGMEYQMSRKAYQTLESEFLQNADESVTAENNLIQEKTDIENRSSDSFQQMVIDFKALQEMNEDIVGWLQFDSNEISYPLLQGKDNETYLHKMADGSENRAGSIFLDVNCSKDLSDSHTIIYGHNMKDGSMFGKLKKYKTEENYYEENRYFTVYTPKQTCRYEIFAWYEVPEVDFVYQLGFVADDTFEKFVAQILERRERDTGVSAGKEDKIVTLSTCSTTGNRLVVHGKQISVCKNSETCYSSINKE